MILSKRINFIRKISLSLFLLSLTALLGSLWLQNTLAEFKYSKVLNDAKLSISQNYYTDKINCTENIQDCRKNGYLNLLNHSKKLGDCFENEIEKTFIIDDKIYKTQQIEFLFVDNKLNNDLKPEFIGCCFCEKKVTFWQLIATSRPIPSCATFKDRPVIAIAGHH